MHSVIIMPYLIGTPGGITGVHCPSIEIKRMEYGTDGLIGSIEIGILARIMTRNSEILKDIPLLYSTAVLDSCHCRLN